MDLKEKLESFVVDINKEAKWDIIYKDTTGDYDIYTNLSTGDSSQIFGDVLRPEKNPLAVDDMDEVLKLTGRYFFYDTDEDVVYVLEYAFSETEEKWVETRRYICHLDKLKDLKTDLCNGSIMLGAKT